MLARFVIWLLRRHAIQGEDKTKVISALLDNVKAVPIADIVTFTPDGTIVVNGKRFDAEQSIAFRESVNGLKTSYARQVFRNQITYEAIKLGVHQGLTPEQIQFSKAALWILQEEEILINKVSTE